jgi:hypothetical protein
MTDERLHEIEQRAEKATQGPWIVGNGNSQSFHQGKNVVVSEGNRVVVDRAIYRDDYDKQTYADIAFIAHARQDIPDLLAYCRELQGAARKVYYARGMLEVGEMSPEEFDEIANNLLKVADGNERQMA